jgi:hypothetical protein
MEFKWFLNDVLLHISDDTAAQDSLSLNLSRLDFNKTLKCTVTESDGQITHAASSQMTLVLFMDPVIKDVLKITDDNFELEVESWPVINFVRISPVQDCANDCVIFACQQEEKCVLNTSPYLNKPSYVQEVTLQRQVYGAKSKIDIFFDIPALSKIGQQLFVQVGNELNIDSAKIDLLQDDPNADLPRQDASTSQHRTTITAVILSLVILVLVIGIIVLIRYRRPISEQFKCGVYLVPHDADDEIEAIEDEDIEKKPLDKTTIGDPNETSL